MNPGTESWIGVLGGGQLGRMLALESRRMGYRVAMWTGGDTSGAAALADRILPQPFDDEQALKDFLALVDVATVEFENVPRSLLEKLEAQLNLMPSALAVATCQHREREKRFLAEHQIPCARFAVVSSAAQLSEALSGMPGDAILKTAEFGYDGKGQAQVEGNATAEQCESLWQAFDSPRAVLEEKVPLAAELSVLVARRSSSEVVTYDPAENQHRNHILDVSILPARLPDAQLEEARRVAIRVAEALDYRGLLAVEFFLAEDGRLLVNEMAPRPHNSGHHTLDACETSQFEQQARILCGLPLGSSRLVQPAVMWNLLGDLWIDPRTPPDWAPILETPGATLHLYGKSEARNGRKMGHVTFIATTREEALENASRCREAFGMEAIE